MIFLPFPEKNSPHIAEGNNVPSPNIVPLVGRGNQQALTAIAELLAPKADAAALLDVQLFGCGVTIGEMGVFFKRDVDDPLASPR